MMERAAMVEGTKIKMKKYVLLIDMVLIVGSLLTVAGFVGYSRPLVIAPIDDYITQNNSVLFEFEKAELILIDDNLEFSSPMEVYVKDNIMINLEPGVYYWKIVGVLESEIRELTVLSKIDLRVKDAGDGKYEVVNSGNKNLDVEIYEHGKLTGKIVLETDEGKEVSGDKFIGGENG